MWWRETWCEVLWVRGEESGQLTGFEEVEVMEGDGRTARKWRRVPGMRGEEDIVDGSWVRIWSQDLEQ